MPADVAIVDGNLIHQKTREKIIEGPSEKMSKSKKMRSSLKRYWTALELTRQEFL